MAQNVSQLRSRLADIDKLLAVGAKNVALDGVNVSFDLEALRAERKNIERQLPELKRKRKGVYRVTGLGG